VDEQKHERKTTRRMGIRKRGCMAAILDHKRWRSGHTKMIRSHDGKGAGGYEAVVVVVGGSLD